MLKKYVVSRYLKYQKTSDKCMRCHFMRSRKLIKMTSVSCSDNNIKNKFLGIALKETNKHI